MIKDKSLISYDPPENNNDGVDQFAFTDTSKIMDPFHDRAFNPEGLYTEFSAGWYSDIGD